MKVENIRIAEQLARKFAKEAGELIQKTKSEGGQYLLMGSALSGNLRRRSLDLTRALAQMRKP